MSEELKEELKDALESGLEEVSEDTLNRVSGMRIDGIEVTVFYYRSDAKQVDPDLLPESIKFQLDPKNYNDEGEDDE